MLRAAGCVFAEEETQLLLAQDRAQSELAALVARRVAGEPLEHVLGWAEFCGLRIAVDQGVFVPRRRTEFLARQAVRIVRRTGDRLSKDPRRFRNPRLGEDREPAVVVVDLCCGSGAVGVAVASLAAPRARVELHAADLDAAAVRCARRNIVAVGGHVHQGDLYAALPSTLRGRVDVLAVNAPYVPSDSIRLMPPEARLHEPRIALDGGADGLDVQRAVVDGAPAWLANGGHLLLETSLAQAPESVAAFARAGFRARLARSERSGGTVVVGRWGGAS